MEKEKLTINLDDIKGHPDLNGLLDLLFSEMLKRGVEARITYQEIEFDLRLNRVDAANDPIYLLVDKK